MPRRQDRRGRSKWTDGHAAILPSVMLKSDAFRSLNGNSVRILLEMLTRYYGSNNGDLSLSLRDIAQLLRMSKSTASAAYSDLEAKGFLVCTSKGTFTRGDASTWRLTFRDAGPRQGRTDEWKIWKQPPRPARVRKEWGSWKIAARRAISEAAAKEFPGTESEPSHLNRVASPNQSAASPDNRFDLEPLIRRFSEPDRS